MKEKLKKYIEENIEKKESFFSKIKNKFINTIKPDDEELMDYDESITYEKNYSYKGLYKSKQEIDVDNFININKNENNFQRLLFNFIDDKNLKDSDVYNKVHIDRRLFSKIRSDSNYHPSRETVLLLGISLELDEDEIDDLLNSASYTLAKNNYYDLIIRFCFINHIYDLKTINDLLNSYNCKLFNY